MFLQSFHIGDLHSAIIHFPIVLIVTALVFDCLAWFNKGSLFQTIAGWLVIVAAFFLVPVVTTGFYAKEFYSADDPDVLRHQYMAIGAAIYTVAHAIFRVYALSSHHLFSIYVYLILSLINVGLINTTAEFGGIVVRGKGIITETLRPEGYPLPYSHVKPK